MCLDTKEGLMFMLAVQIDEKFADLPHNGKGDR
jgi:hypothetical protein